MSPIPPPLEDNDPMRAVTMRLPISLLAELDAVADEVSYSREALVRYFLRWAVEDYRRAKSELAAADAESAKKPRAPKK